MRTSDAQQSIICWLCRRPASRACYIDLVWLCDRCTSALAAQALRHSALRHNAAQQSQEQHAQGRRTTFARRRAIAEHGHPERYE
jgi:hypothetical protein